MLKLRANKEKNLRDAEPHDSSEATNAEQQYVVSKYVLKQHPPGRLVLLQKTHNARTASSILNQIKSTRVKFIRLTQQQYQQQYQKQQQ
jgi:hypothetical protein